MSPCSAEATILDVKPSALCTEDSMKPEAIIGGLSVLLAGLITNAPPVRSRLKTPTIRAVAAGLLAAVIVVGGVLIEGLVFNAR